MTMRRHSVVAAFAMLLVSSCGKDGQPEQSADGPTRSIEFFKNNETERKRVTQLCEHGVGDFEYQLRRECMTARFAQDALNREADARGVKP